MSRLKALTRGVILTDLDEYLEVKRVNDKVREKRKEMQVTASARRKLTVEEYEKKRRACLMESEYE